MFTASFKTCMNTLFSLLIIHCASLRKMLGNMSNNYKERGNYDSCKRIFVLNECFPKEAENETNQNSTFLDEIAIAMNNNVGNTTL